MRHSRPLRMVSKRACSRCVRTVEALGEPFAVVDQEHLHQLVVAQARQELGRNKEIPVCQCEASWSLYILSGLGSTRDFDHLVVDRALRTWVHALVDLVHQGERRAGELGEAEQIEDGGQRAFLAVSNVDARGVRTPPDCRWPVRSCNCSVSRNLTRISMPHFS